MHQERIRAAAREWVERRVRFAQWLALAGAGAAAVGCLLATAWLWGLAAFAVLVGATWLGVPGGWWIHGVVLVSLAWLYGWLMWKAVQADGLPEIPLAPRRAAFSGLVLGTLAMLFSWRSGGVLWLHAGRRHGSDAGLAVANFWAAVLLLGPNLMVRTWLALRRHAALAAVHTTHCAMVIAASVAEDRKLEFETLQRRLPRISVEQVRSDLALIDAVRILPGPPPGLLMRAADAEQIAALVGARAEAAA